MDDFRVTEVWVEIYTAADSLLESGMAEQQFSGIDWAYSARKDNSLLAGSRVKATARDVPGNEESLKVVV